MIGVTGMQHVALEVGDLDTARAFYVDVLGLRVLDRPDFLAQAVVPGMKAAGGGTIVNLSSSAWLGVRRAGAVHAAKGGEGLTGRWEQRSARTASA